MIAPNDTQPCFTRPHWQEFPNSLRSPRGILVAIDSRVTDPQRLAEGTIAGANVLIIESQRDGIAQIASALRDRGNIAQLHIISHGTSGSLGLGNTQLTRENLESYAPWLQNWQSFRRGDRSNSPPLEILLYGCEVAKGVRGRQFVEQFSRLTGAHIAASTSLTGNAALGGNWQLEDQTGKITSPLALTAKIMADYPAVFADFNVSAGDVAGLISAINQANDEVTNPGADNIILTNSTFTLTTADNNSIAFGGTGLPIITSEITIEGNSSIIERSSSENFRFFVVDDSSANLTLNNLTLQGGSVTNTSQSLGDDGGALLNHGGTVTINDSTITGNFAADDGGALVNVGIVSATPATMTINNTTISNNTAQGDGGNDDGGGAIENDGNLDETGSGGATLTIMGGTISGNTSNGGEGGGIRIRDGATISIDGVSITGNSAAIGSGIATNSDSGTISITLQNTTVTGNSGGQNVEDTNISGTPPNATNSGGNNIGSSNIPEFQTIFDVTRVDTGATIEPDDEINLGTLIVGADPIVTTFQIANNSSVETLEITSISSSNSSLFPIDSSFTVPITLNAGNSTTFDVTFDPTIIGTFQSTVSFTTDDISLTNFDFTLRATVTDTTPPPPPPPPSSILSVDSNNVFTVGGIGGSNLEVTLLGANTSNIADVKLLRLNDNNQTLSVFELFSALPNGFRPSNFSAALQANISGTFNADDRFAIEVETFNGQTISFSPQNLSVSDRGNGVFSLGFRNGLSLELQQTTASAPLGVGSNQGTGFEVIDLTNIAGTVQANFTAYREAVFSNVVGLYKIDDVNGTVGGIAPGSSGYAQAAISNRVSDLELSVSNQSVSRTSVTLEAGALYAPYIIVDSTPARFLSNNPNNSAGGVQAYFLFAGANPDSTDHLLLLGNNTFGFEDLFGGGDLDYNDLIFTVDIA